jgi:tetratricopeptide (TPR) repeat protein
MSPLSDWLLDSTQGCANLRLLFSAGPEDFIDTQEIPFVDFHIPVLSSSDLLASVSDRFNPNDFRPDIYPALWSYCRGYRGRLAVKMADLLSADAIFQSSDGAWHLRDEFLTSPAGSSIFGPDVYEPIRAALHKQAPEQRRRLQTFLQLAAICGEVVLPVHLAAKAGVPEEEIDQFIDLIDDDIGNEIFEDLGYRNPSFPGQLVYRFHNPVVRQMILERLGETGAGKLCDDLLIFLQSRIPMVQSRGVARLYLELSRHSSDVKRLRIEHQLAWWIGAEEADELCNIVRRTLKTNRLSAADLMSEIEKHFFDWPAYKTVALLNALCDDKGSPQLPLDLVPAFYALRAPRLFDLGKVKESWDDAQLGLQIADKGSIAAFELNQISGSIARDRGDFRAALQYLENARAILRGIVGPDDLGLVPVSSSLAGLYKELGMFREAEQLYLEMIPLLRSLGTKHRALATMLDNLAMLYAYMDRDADAEPLCRQARHMYIDLLGPDHKDSVIATCNLGTVLRDLGLHDEAEPLLITALKGYETLFGRESLWFASALDNLSALYRRMSRYQDAESLAVQSLEIYEKLGQESPDVETVLSNLARIFRAQGKVTEEKVCFKRAIVLRSKIFAKRWQAELSLESSRGKSKDRGNPFTKV